MADKLYAQKSPIYAPAGIAINGYDAVAFFTDQKPIKGTESYAMDNRKRKTVLQL
jgi:hypothetical protein